MGSGHFEMNGKINKTKHDEKCPKKHPKEGVATFKQNARKTTTTLSTERLMTSGPTPGQLSSILLQLREDVCAFCRNLIIRTGGGVSPSEISVFALIETFHSH